MDSDSATRSTQQDTFLRGKLQSGRVYPEFFALQPSAMVVNLGCGRGPQAIIYRGQFQRMIGIDINDARLAASQPAIQAADVQAYDMVCGDVENVPLVSGSFDAVIAIDIIEHVAHPDKLLQEVHRLLKPDGQLLITFPAMHDRYTHAITRLGQLVGRRRRPRPAGDNWDPDAHNQDLHTNQWIALAEQADFVLDRSRATTLFPPLHLYGIPRFWFTNETIHRIDRFFCHAPGLKRYGQGLLCVFRKA